MSRKKKIPLPTRATHQSILPVVLAVLGFFYALPAQADRPGCEYKTIDVGKYGEKPLQNPPEIRSHNGVLTTDLVVQYSNPETLNVAGCPLHLRTYGGQLAVRRCA